MKSLILGILAHVDAGKTTLSESLLHKSGRLKKAGRVDKGDTFLDTYALEKQRGITIFSKQAIFSYGDLQITLMDTPGHVDFSAEMERTLQVLDGAILVINGAEGIQAHTRTLWKLLEQYDVPVIIFVNKMDQPVTDREALQAELKTSLDEGCIDFCAERSDDFYENIAVCEEHALEQYLESGSLEESEICRLIMARKVFPCYFGSALKEVGVEELLDGISRYLRPPVYPQAFGARVYKIGRDEQGARLTYLKVTGGSLAVRDLVDIRTAEGEVQEKVSQIRFYSGDRYETTTQLEAGMAAAVTGLEHTFAGAGLGTETETTLPLLAPALSCQMLVPEGCDPVRVLQAARFLTEEEPQLHVEWDEMHREIRVKLMGEIQTQILRHLMQERFGMEVDFGPGSIVYKETIADTVEGVGHFEPLRHYAEVHLLLEPGEPGSGLVFEADCSEDVLDRNWQRLVLTHLREREHRGVLTGSAITDMKITLKSGKAHLKHTEGGDFRQAVYRAVRQGLMQAQSVLLEPYYDFVLEVPSAMTGRAMTDLERLHARAFQPEIKGETAVLRGSAPVACMQAYHQEVVSYTKGQGSLTCTMKGYAPCHNAEEVLAERAYDPERDVRNCADSVFCAHGAGFTVPWYEVARYMHLPSILSAAQILTDEEIREYARRRSPEEKEIAIGTEEIDAILNRTAYANRKDSPVTHKGISARRKRPQSTTASETRVYRPRERKPEYLLVDGYNIIFAWEELRELAQVSLDGARGRLLDILCNYQGVRGCELIAVFDAYRLEGHAEETLDYHNIHVVYTKEAETADQYIEKFAHENSRQYQISVATSDGLEQIIIRGAGCILISARELEEEIRTASAQVLQTYEERQESGRIFLGDIFPKEL
ncbi:translation factor GTPase family protein [Lachnospiraceae bacterium JLR.KK008]